MTTAYAASSSTINTTGFGHHQQQSNMNSNQSLRDGSLLKKKQEQWAKEKATCESWFPFGSPGGGAPNRKYEAFSPQTSDAAAMKTDRRSPSRHSNEDSGRSSGSDTNHPPKEDSEGVIRGPTSQRIPCPFSVASTSSAHPSVILTQPAQMIVESVSARQQHSLPPVGARTTSYIASLPTPSSNCPIPVQFVYASNANGQAVPVPVEFIQSPSNLAAGIPYAYPVRMISPMTLNIAPTTSADGTHHELPVLTPSSYTEHWANHLPYWGSTVARGIDENAKTMQNITNDSTTSMSLPPIGTGMQSTLSGLRAGIPTTNASSVRSPHSSEVQTCPAAQQLGMDDALRKSLSESLSSLNSSSRRSADDDSRIRAAKKTEQIYNEQVAERRRLEAQRIEDEKREAMIKEQERRRMEELERERESEEERKKLKHLEDRERTEAALLASIERAKREAEMLKKAKLYKHVLESCESNAALEHSILSEDDRENSRILREVESLERQKQYDFQRLGSGSRSSSAKRALTERGADLNRSTPHSRNNSYDDDRPIKGTFNSSYISKSFGSTPESSSPLCRDRRGRQSMRAPSTPRTNLPRRRADSAERSKNTSSSPVRCSLEKPVSLDRPRATQGAQCLIPVRPQRRIPPPAPRSRRTSSTNDTITPETVTPVTLTTSPSTVTYSTTKAAESFDMIPNGDGGRSRMISSHTIDSSSFPTEKSIQSTQSQDVLVEKPTKMPLRESKSFSTDREIERSFTAPKQSYHDDLTSRLKRHNTQNYSVTNSSTNDGSIQQICSDESSVIISETPKNRDRTGSKAKLKMANGNESLLTENPLFQPVSTRCRRARNSTQVSTNHTTNNSAAKMGNTDVARESSSCSSGSSPPPMSTEDESVSPQKLLHNSSTLNGYKDVSSKKPPITAPKPIIRSSAIKIARADSSSSEHVARSPFKQTLAESGSLNRHREELFSPEIRRRCELPVSSKLRSSLANLTTDESDDGRASPVAPFIQRFNSKTSQYRSFNMKKTSERNQKVLDQLAQLRAQLKQKQQQMERTFAKVAVNSNAPMVTRAARHNNVTHSDRSAANTSGEAVAV